MRDPAATPAARQQRVQALRWHDWVVYARTPTAGPAAVLDYLLSGMPSSAAFFAIPRTTRSR